MKPVLLLTVLSIALGAFLLFAEGRSNDTAAPDHTRYASGRMLAVKFAHADHVDQTCISCHHNYVDDTGQGLCFDCHKTDPAVAELIETQFHDLCRGCHLDEALAGHATHGPTRRCISCHVADDAP